jgi:PAS domain S-box-containing protein
MVLPSLILRLEQLAQPDAPPLPAASREPAADAAPANAEPAPAPPIDPYQPDPVPSSPSTSAPRRVVDVAAPERLSTATPLSRWSAAVAAAHDACFVLDLNGAVISISVAAVELLGCGDAAIIGRHALDVLNLVDLETGAVHPDYAPRITPLAVLDGPGLGRSLMRVRHEDGAVVTLDTSSAPIHDVNAHLLGSVTFIAPIPAR